MGCAQSTRPSMRSPQEGLERKKLENGYSKGPYNGPRRSTGMRHNKLESYRTLNPEKMRNVNENAVTNGNAKFVRSENNGNRLDLANKGGLEEELVDGWPKWLTDNIPREALKNIVPRSADSYAKIDKIGAGTYSNVYKARDKETGKIVALKKVRFDTSEPESVKFMAREIMILQKLDHPNIVKLKGLATSRMQYSLYLVFEYMHSDLAKILSRPDEMLTEPQIKFYMQQLLSGLQHCHERGILHRDIKGSNLLIDRNGMLKIADFGLANFEKRRPLTSRVVTLWYRAPELLLGSTDYGAGIDLWSAGCLLAEMFAGRPIMPARTEVEQLHKIFKLCGTPSADFYKRLKLSSSLKPPQTYKPTLREAFRHFPSSSLGLLNILLSLDPAYRGSAASALDNEFFQRSPLACDLSGLPKIHVEDDEQDLMKDKRKHRTKARRRSQSQREQRKKNLAAEKLTADVEGSKEEQQKRADTSIFSIEPGSSTTSTSSTGVFRNNEMYPRTESHPNATKNIKNPKRHTTNSDSTNRLDLVQRSSSSREYRNLGNGNLINVRDVDD